MIPVDLEDAARIDGLVFCAFTGMYVAAGQPDHCHDGDFTFMGTWNNFIGPLIFLNNEYC
jgi:ABC-type glycerol-3-phosphate transport system permease component